VVVAVVVVLLLLVVVSERANVRESLDMGDPAIRQSERRRHS